MKVRSLQQVGYASCLQAMRDFTAQRCAATEDEAWLIEHPAVFTLGQAAKPEHILSAGTIPVVQTERGGQVTYHGPGQLVVYLLLDLKRANLLVRDLVCKMEQSVIQTLADFGIEAFRQTGAPGVYVASKRSLTVAKIASLGIKVSRGCTYHGLALNVNMDLSPFERINPCGYAGLVVTDIAQELGKANSDLRLDPLGHKLIEHLRPMLYKLAT